MQTVGILRHAQMTHGMYRALHELRHYGQKVVTLAARNCSSAIHMHDDINDTATSQI